MSDANITWQWPTHVRAWWFDVGPCDRYWCKFTNSGRGIEVGDVKRCKRHGRLLVVTETEYTRGGSYLARYERLRPWRIGYWRARRMLAARLDRATKERKDA